MLHTPLAIVFLLVGDFVQVDAALVPSAETPRETRGVLLKTDAVSPGFTLVAPLQSKSTYLVDLDGTVVREWKSDSLPGQAAYLRENGHLLRAERVQNGFQGGGGAGGRVRELDLDGNVVWEYVCSDATRLSHHDFEFLPNGHLLLIAWERKRAEEAFEAGRHPRSLQIGEFWPDMLLEIELTPPSGGNVVWEWHAWDHVIQERATARPNYGKIAEHPERIDVNADRPARSEEEEARELDSLRRLGYVEATPRASADDARTQRVGSSNRGDWLHANAVAFEPELDLIALSVHSISEVWIIDHSTTSAEASTSKGGRRGQGGDLLARFGNPQVHGAGTTKEQVLFGQHDVQWITGGESGPRRLLVFNNGLGKLGSGSSVDEFAIDLSLESVNRGLPRVTQVWTYADARIDSGHLSGVQRLPNGNTLICAGETGRIVEVTPRGEIAWDFLSPFGDDVAADPTGERAGAAPRPGLDDGSARLADAARDARYSLFRASRYADDHPGVVAALLRRSAQR
ncbi:MAG: aryl-sulfate sulfotransferase [Planctomycetes bacterium]|nr:aryl-sulfate sulfotransferase [Planctomycetota bacterium]